MEIVIKAYIIIHVSIYTPVPLYIYLHTYIHTHKHAEHAQMFMKGTVCRSSVQIMLPFYSELLLYYTSRPIYILSLSIGQTKVDEFI